MRFSYTHEYKNVPRRTSKMRQTPNSIKFEICTFLKLTTPIATTVTLMIAKNSSLAVTKC